MQPLEAKTTSHPDIRAAIASGHFEAALRTCQTVLGKHPSDPEALTLLGIAAIRLRIGDLAENSLRAAMKFAPESIEPIVWLARYLLDILRLQDAGELYHRALSMDDSCVDAMVGIGRCLLSDWQNLDALVEFDRALSIDATAVEAWAGRGTALRRIGALSDSLEAFDRGLSEDPADPNVHVGRVLLLSLLGRSDESETAFASALATFSGDSPVLTEFGRLFWTQGDSGHAVRALRAASAAEIADEYPRRMLGRVLQEIGEFDEAKSLLRESLALHPKNPLLYEELVFARRFEEEDRPLIEAMRMLLRNRGISPFDRRRLNFALGKASDDLGDYSKAMQHFDEANGIGHMQIWPGALDKEKLAREVDATIKTYSRDFFEKFEGLGDATDVPIFIIGMIRSGTTLVEQIVSSHPAVGAAGEVTYFLDHGSGLVEPGHVPDQAKVAEFTRGYMNRLRSAVPTASHVTDKMPTNFTLAGLAHLAFPNAKIIHTRRNALDTCLSIYVTPSVANYAHSFADIAFYYREYERLMAHWRTVLPPNRFFEVDYQSLVSQREQVVRELIEFLELPWDDALLRHEQNVRSIETPSKWQARQPVYQSSVERWRRYEPWIGELLREFPDLVVSSGKV